MTAVDRATFAAAWREATEAWPDRTFLIWEDGDERVTSWTYEQFGRIVSEVGAGLARNGAGPDGAVHVVLMNSPAFVAAWLAAIGLGATFVPSDPRASAAELGMQIDRTAPAVGLYATSRAATYEEAARDRMIALPVDESDIELDILRAQPQVHDWPRPRDRAAVMFTSGTTSTPKGVMVTQANYAFAGEVMAAAARMDAEDRALVVLPMFHANAQYYSFAAAITVGASVALMSAFSATRFLEQATRHGATHASLFAAPMRMILAKGARAVEGIRLRHVWYAQNISSSQYEQLSELFGCRPRQLYGMTETLPAVLTNRRARPVPESLGSPTLGCLVDIWSGPGHSAADGEVGQIVVGGVPGVTLFDGYLDDPDTTARSYHDGWFLSGDRARRDPDGEIYFDGRSSDVLKVGGENVSTVEVESVVAAHASVLEAAVVGRSDPVLDEVPVAFVVQDPSAPSLDIDELKAFCDDRLAPSKRPRDYHLVDELPRTSVGKIRKFELRDLA